MRDILRILPILFICICVAFSGLTESSECKELKTSPAEDAGTSAGLLISSLQEIPQSGDTVSCEDGSTYEISDVSNYA